MSRVPSRYSSENIFHKNVTIYENDNNDSIILNASNITDGGYMLTFPENDGNTDQVLSTNGSGILSWVDQSSGLEENVSVSGTLSVSGTTTLNSDTTINADLNISNNLNVSGTSTIDGISTFNNNVTINGSLTVNGSSTYVYSENLVIKDPLIKLADQNSTDNLDIGFYGEYNNKYSGLIRNPNDEEWYLFKDSIDDPPNMNNLEQANLNSNLDGGVVIKVIAKTTLTKGHAVYIHSDTDNDNTYVDKAIANDTSKMPSFGLILKDTNASNTGYVITLGNIINVNASYVVENGITLNNGDICYISASETGKITNVAPSGESNLIQNIGIVIRINNNNVSLRVGGAGRTNACPSLNHNNIFIGDSNNNVSTTSFNDALSNSNAVLTSGDQTIDGTKTFNNTISASITGNAGTVTNGIYTTSSVTDLSDISSSGSGQIITSAERTKLTNFNASDINGSITNNQLEYNSMTIDGTSVSLGGSINTSNTTYTNGSGITLTGTTFSANVDDTSIEHDTNGKISIKNSGVTNSMLSGSIANDKLAGSIANDKLAGSISNDKLTNDSITIDGTLVALGGSINTSNTQLTDEQVQNIVGGMFTGNTETGITATYQDTDGTIDLVVGTLNQDTTGNADTSTLASTVTVTDSTANTDFPIVFHNESNALLDDTGSFIYNPSSGTLSSSNSTISDLSTINRVEYTNSNVMKFNQYYQGNASGSYFENNEYQKILTITPSGNTENYHIQCRISANSAQHFHHVYINAGLRSNTLPDLDWNIYYDEEYNNHRYIDPLLWTKETTTAGFILAFKALRTIYGNVTCDITIIPRFTILKSNISINSTSSSEQTSVDSGFTSNDMTKVLSKNGSTLSTTGNIITENKIGTATDQEYINFDTSNEVNTFVNDTERLSVTNTGVDITGNLTVSGSYNLASGDIPNNAANTTGNADTATALETARNINGVAFDGTGDITVTAAGSTLSDIVPVSKGGTNATSFSDKSVIITQDTGTETLAAASMSTNGQLLIGGTSGPSVATLTSGSNITITNSDGGITIASTDTNTQLTDEQVQDIVGAMFSSNTETGITVTYQDTDGTIDLVIGTNSITNDMLAGSISNDKLAGSISNDKLVNSSMTINGTSVALGDSITTPDTNTTYSSGSGITLTGTTFSANVDDTSIEHDTNGKISIKNSGVTNDMLTGSISNDKLAGSISNDKLVNSSMTINGTSVALGDSITTPDTNTTYSSGSGITLTGTTFSANVDDTTIGFTGNNLTTIKVPNALTAGTNISFSSGTTYDGSVSITINASDTDTTYQGGKNITVDTASNPDEIDLDDDLTGIDSITFTSTASASDTSLTGNNYPAFGYQTPMTYFDLRSTTNLIPGAVLATKIQRTSSIRSFSNVYSEYSSNFRTSFTAQSANVMVEFRALVRADNKVFYGGLYNYATGSYNADTRNRFNYNDETDQDFTVLTWWMRNLTPGNTYYISPYFRGSSSTVYIYAGHGGATDGFAPGIMRVIDGGNNVDIY